MIGKLGRKYIFFGISAIRADVGVAEVDKKWVRPLGGCCPRLSERLAYSTR
jgi:hypothetical protein